MSRAYNFSPGPAMLPEPVLRQAQAEMLEWRDARASLVELSHRGAAFIEVAQQAARGGLGLSHALGEFGADGFLHLAGQLAHDIVEQAKLVGAMRRFGEEKQVGDAAQQFSPPLAGWLLGHLDQVVKFAAHGFAGLTQGA